MNCWCVMMVKDEADLIAGTLTHLADEGLAGILVADNGSTDGTREILDQLTLPCELVIVDDPEPAYYQSQKMSALAATAAAKGAEWILPVDADELWIGPDRIDAILDSQPARVMTVNAALYNHFPSAIDPDESDPFRSIVWRQPNPAPLPKVAFRWQDGAVIHQGNHGVDLPRPGQYADGLEIRHFPYRSADQFVRKARNGAAAYAATDLPDNQGAHWRQYGALLDRFGENVLEDVFREHFWFLAPVEGGLTLDPAPYLRWR